MIYRKVEYQFAIFVAFLPPLQFFVPFQCSRRKEKYENRITLDGALNQKTGSPVSLKTPSTFCNRNFIGVNF